MKPLKGRLIAELIPEGGERASGIIIIDRKSVADKAEVLSVGADSMQRGGRPFKRPAEVGDIVYFKRYTPMMHDPQGQGMKKGTVTIWWDDVVAVKQDGKIKAVYDDILVKVVYKEISSLIIIPDSEQKQIHGFHGEVMSVGEEYPYDVEVGDRVIFPRNEGILVKDEDQELFCLKERRVLAKEAV